MLLFNLVIICIRRYLISESMASRAFQDTLGLFLNDAGIDRSLHNRTSGNSAGGGEGVTRTLTRVKSLWPRG